MTTSPAPDPDGSARALRAGDLTPPGLPEDAEVVEVQVEQRSYRTRSAARERALGLLYEAEAKQLDPAALIADLPVAPDPFTTELVCGVGEHQDELDVELTRVSARWDVNRMPAIDRALLRMGTFELAHRPEVPVAVVINEAVELAKRFSTDDSSRFVNGVLSRLADDLRP